MKALIAVVFILIGCGRAEEPGVEAITNTKPEPDLSITRVPYNSNGMTMFTVKHTDNCEYVVLQNSFNGNLQFLHSPTCNNPKHHPQPDQDTTGFVRHNDSLFHIVYLHEGPRDSTFVTLVETP